MTARLVGLMSIVLFLSLLAFSLLLNHSRTAVLEEVQKTVGRVGEQTLHAVLRGEAGQAIPTALDPGADAKNGPQGSRGRTTAVPAVPFDDQRRVEDLLREGMWASPVLPNPRMRISGARFLIAHDTPRTNLGGDEVEMRVTILMAESAYAADVDGNPSRLPDAPAVSSAERARGVAPVSATDVSGTTVPSAVRNELFFTVPVAEYARVFDAIRERMIWLFIGVFVVGLALFAALARRFTRPIRNLDGALQQVTGGHLDVAVTPSGGAELERVAIAFNTMVTEMRANRDRERELIRREKLSALGRLAAGVAHDVRNPLHSIGLTLQNIEEACRPESEERQGLFDRAVGLIRREIKRLDGLVANFLAFAHNEAAVKQSVRLSDLVRETAQLVAKEAERREIIVVVDAEPTLEPIEASAASLRSAILNLVLNAFEATPPGGRVALRVTANEGTQCVEVSDTGRGIKLDDRERVFDFGFTSREGGHGLGLAMVHHTIVEEHGGRVTIDSVEGKGTQVRLELPAGGSPA